MSLRLEHLESDIRQFIREEVDARVESALRDEGFLRSPGAAAYLDMTEDALEWLRRKGRIVPIKRDGRLYYDKRILRGYVEGRR